MHRAAAAQGALAGQLSVAHGDGLGQLDRSGRRPIVLPRSLGAALIGGVQTMRTPRGGQRRAHLRVGYPQRRGVLPWPAQRERARCANAMASNTSGPALRRSTPTAPPRARSLQLRLRACAAPDLTTGGSPPTTQSTCSTGLDVD